MLQNAMRDRHSVLCFMFHTRGSQAISNSPFAISYFCSQFQNSLFGTNIAGRTSLFLQIPITVPFFRVVETCSYCILFFNVRSLFGSRTNENRNKIVQETNHEIMTELKKDANDTYSIYARFLHKLKRTERVYIVQYHTSCSINF